MSAHGFALVIPCPYCGAGVDEPCVAKGGGKATFAHSMRTNPLYEVWIDGFREGQEDAIACVDDNTPWSRRAVDEMRERVAKRYAS